MLIEAETLRWTHRTVIIMRELTLQPNEYFHFLFRASPNVEQRTQSSTIRFVKNVLWRSQTQGKMLECRYWPAWKIGQWFKCWFRGTFLASSISYSTILCYISIHTLVLKKWTIQRENIEDMKWWKTSVFEVVWQWCRGLWEVQQLLRSFKM